MGYCLAPANLMVEFRKVHQFVVFTSNSPVQYALAEYMKNKNYLQLPEFFQQKRDYFLGLISGSRFKYKPSAGSYFQLLDYSAITKEKDTAFAIRLTKEFGVASIPMSVFYQKAPESKLLRFCFAKKAETLEKAAELLCKI
jgi:methionine aminotransferase